SRPSTWLRGRRPSGTTSWRSCATSSTGLPGTWRPPTEDSTRRPMRTAAGRGAPSFSWHPPPSPLPPLRGTPPPGQPTPGADVRDALDAEHAAAVIAYYGVRGRTILHVDAPLAATAATLGVDPARLRHLLDESRPALRAARARRTPPDIDTKIVTAWNGLAI